MLVMKLAIYTKDPALKGDPRFRGMLDRLSASGCTFYDIGNAEDLQDDTSLVLSVGGDGTFLSASKRVALSGVPLVGVNLGRLGFLSEYSPEEVAEALPAGAYSVEDRALLRTDIDGQILGTGSSFWPYSLNEISILRSGAAILGVNVTIGGDPLPTYWGDGLLVATSSGSTAYSLSVGGPICLPEARVLVVAPIAPHNLNVRPLIVPHATRITLSFVSRDDQVTLSMDNRTVRLAPSSVLSVGVAQFSLKRVRLERSNFIRALTTKLYWGEDRRNADTAPSGRE